MEQCNVGPNGGGSYDNADNSLVLGGSVVGNEATQMTGVVIGSLPVQDAMSTRDSGSRSAGETEMRGGNV